MKKDRWLSRFLELLGSMRLAICLLVVVSIASVIGTIIEQEMPIIVYQDQFGLFWYQVFDKLSIFSIYNATWFLVVVGFLCVSTTICVINRAPNFVREMKSWRLGVREKSFLGFKHQFKIQSIFDQERTQQLIGQWLSQHKFKFKTQLIDDQVTLFAAKKGLATKLGYIFAHGAIIVICLGGLMDSRLPSDVYVWLAGKQPIPEQARTVADVPEHSWLSVHNLSFKSNVQLSSRATQGTEVATVFLGENRYLQDLPFSMKLKEFRVEYYPNTAMPKRFSSLVTFTDKETQEVTDAVVEVNHPYISHGIAVYQSSFADGGSKAWFSLRPLLPVDSKQTVQGIVARQPIRFMGVVQGPSIGLTNGFSLDVLEVKPMNIELDETSDMNNLTSRVLGSAAPKTGRNVNYGPSVMYRIKHANGDHQYHTYMNSVDLGNKVRAFITVVDPQKGKEARLLRIPVDELGTSREFEAVRQAFQLDSVRAQAVQQFLRDFPLSANMDQGLDEKMRFNLVNGVVKVFAQQGFEGLQSYSNNAAQFVIAQNNAQGDESFKEETKRNFEGFFSQIVQGVLVETRNIVRTQLRLSSDRYTPIDIKEGKVSAHDQSWVLLSMIAMSNLQELEQPFYMSIDHVEHIQDTVLQVNRSPGKWFVYLGAVLLMLGVYFMIFVRDRRLWFLCKQTASGVEVRVAMNTQKYTLDFQDEFDALTSDFSKMDKGSL